ncbi:TPA: acylneuraminate cytidylyltransferase [Streptococcus suis]|nr:acylneuraminate cytidylyltransferase [Streptococcus suis]HEM6320504.1 acylneuraminate cytidylyltransferase [Streptococcus suis]HEM6346734.1 acylneuraminate cytidylyltransferase [Streptococcus suis]
MEPICLIPARSGSKGLPNKNMLFLDGVPMIFHTIRAAIESGCFKKENIYVSTDSEVYKEICETTGVQVLMRPADLATDFTTSFQLNEHFLQDFSDDQVFVLLQVTSPLRTGKHVKEAMELYEKGQADHVVSFTKVDKSPTLFSTLDENGFAKDIAGLGGSYRRQDEKILYYPNGAIYISSKQAYLADKTYFSEKTAAYVMTKEDSIDVDDHFDFTGVIGRIYFDYQRREQQNKPFYKRELKRLCEQRVHDSLVIGDSRLLALSLDGFDNISIGGMTAATALENQGLFLATPIKKVLLSIGVNDLITDYPLHVIKDTIRQLMEALVSKAEQVFVTTIAYTLFRDSVSNEEIVQLNNFIVQSASELGISVIDLNEVVEKEGMLDYQYTNDGLHFNQIGQERVNQLILTSLTR